MEKPIKIKIVYDGAGPGYMGRIIDATTGQTITGITHATIDVDIEGEVRAILTVRNPDIEVTVDSQQPLSSIEVV